MDGTGIHESMSWLIHKWKKKLAKAILSWLVGQCCDGSHKQECRKPWGMVLYPLRQLKWSFQKRSLHSTAGIAQNHFSSPVGDVRLLRSHPGLQSSLCLISITPGPCIWSASRALFSLWQKWCIRPETGHGEDARAHCDLKWQLHCCLLSPLIVPGAVQITPKKPQTSSRNWNVRPGSRGHICVDE